MNYPGVFGLFSGFMDDYARIKEKQEEKKEEIKVDWQKTYTMPRKMKKQKRKELELDWQIANWDLGF